MRCASAWHRPAGSRCARSPPFTRPGDLASTVEAWARVPSCSSPPHGPPWLDRVRVPPRSPAAPLVCPLRLPAPIGPGSGAPCRGPPLRRALVLCPMEPTTRAPANVSCVGDGAPARHKTGVRPGEARASQVPGPSSSFVPWSNTPPETGLSLPTSRRGRWCLQSIQPPGPPGSVEGSGPHPHGPHACVPTLRPPRDRDQRKAHYRRGRAHPWPDGFCTRWTTNNVSWSHPLLHSPLTSRAWSH
jgi:hypothetical protein